MCAFNGSIEHDYEQFKHKDGRYSDHSTPTNGLQVSEEEVWAREADGTKFSAFMVTKWTYLHYNEAKDLVYCHTCLWAFAEKQIKAANAYAAFVIVLANHEIK